MDQSEEGQDAPESGGRIAKLLPQLLHSKLNVRTAALGQAADCLVDSIALELKPVPLRKLLRTILTIYLDTYKQVVEKKWRLALQGLLLRSVNIKDLPFSAHDVYLELFQERGRDKRENNDACRAGLIHIILSLAVAMVKSKLQDSDGDAILAGYVTLVGEQLLLLENEAHEQEVVLKIGELVKTSPIMAAAFNLHWLADQPVQPLLFLASAQAVLPFLTIPEQKDSLKSRLLDAFLKRIVQHKTPASLSISSLKKLSYFISVLTAAEWAAGSDDGLEGQLLKNIKKAPEGSSLLMAVVASQLKLASLASFAVGGAMAAALRMLRSQAADVRINGRTLIRNLVRKSSDADALAIIAKLSIETLQGKGSGGALTQLWQRTEVANVFSVIADYLPAGIALTDRSRIAATEALPALFAAIDKESIDDIRALMACAAGKWLALLGDQIPPAVSDCLKAGLTKVKSAAYLLLIVQAISINRDIVEKLVPLAVALCASSAVKKPLAGVQVDAVLSYRIIAECSVFSSEVFQAAESGKLWAVFSAEGCFLYNKAIHAFSAPASVAGSAADEDETNAGGLTERGIPSPPDGSKVQAIMLAESQMAVVCIATQRGFSQSLVKGAPPSGAIDCMLSCLLHPSAEIRKFTSERLSDIAECNNDKALVALLQSLFILLTSQAAHRESAERALLESKEGDPQMGLLSAAPPSRVSEALLSICAAIKSPKSHLLLPILTICSHPGANGSSLKRAAGLWKLTKKHIDVDALNVGGSKTFSELASLIVSQIRDNSDATRQSGKVATVLLALRSEQWGKEIVKESLLPALISALEKEELTSVSPEDISSFLNPQAALAAALASASEVAVDLRITNADRRKDGPRSSRKGNFGSDFVEDEEWAERVKAEKLKKAQQTKAGGDDPLEKKRRELEGVSSRLNDLVAKSRRVLVALGMLVECCSKERDGLEVLRGSSGLILPELLQLLPCALVEDDAYATLLKLCNASIDTELVPPVRDLADSLRLVAKIISPDLDRLSTVTPSAIGKKAASEREEMQKKFKKMVELSGPPSRFLKALAGLLGRGGSAQYSPSPIAVQLCYPVFRGLLQLPGLVTGCELAFTLFDASWPMSAKLPLELKHLCRSALETCLVVLSQLRVDPSPEVTILRIVSQENGLSVDDWAPLFGDHGMCSSAVNVRMTCIRAISRLMRASSSSSTLLTCRLYQAKHDSDDAVKALAVETWGAWSSSASATSPLPTNFLDEFLPLLKHEVQSVREATAKALANAILLHPSMAQKVVAEVQAVYKAAMPPAPLQTKSAEVVKVKGAGLEKDFGAKKPMPMASMALLNDKNASAVDLKAVSLRIAVSIVFATMGSDKSLPPGDSDLILQVLDFILVTGAVDSSSDVRTAMLTAGRAFVDGYASTLCSPILTVLNAVLQRQPVKGEDLSAYDHRHEAAVVLLGVAGKHLDKDDPMVITIAETLVGALKIPAESVQRAVAECLAPLVQAVKTSDRIKEMFEQLMTQVTDSPSYGERRGAAFGVSAFVKGMGITSLKQHDVVNRFREACESGSVDARQGGFGAFECLSERLGMLFEPYITTIVPVLLKSFSHGSDHVREAAQIAAKVIMGRLSAHGVKVVLTPILTSLPTETAWKTRQEAIRLLGTMAHCAPKQLASCLPQIVPRLVEAGYDPHPKVKESAKSAMIDISSVIKNPEVARLSPVLLSALSDPANKTKDALEALLECEFMHSIDAPSLALLVPILARALRDRGADLKRKSAAITGNMMTMVSDPKFLLPYLQQVLPGLRDCLLDPIPDVRATSAKALGSLIAGVGEEEELAELVPWLTSTLCAEASPVERSGAAQGLAEVCLALGNTRLEEILQQTLPLHLSSKGAAREGLLWLLSFLPAVVREGFADHISTTLPVVLTGLADSIESVREVAMRAGQIMVSTLGKTHTLELLPSLCDGMFDDDWHIRHSSVMLLGELLYLIGETKAMGLIDGDDDNDDDGGVGNTSRVSITIRAHLGSQTTDSMLASLYIARSDISNMVRQSALQVWKSVVSNTPRTLVEIMNELVMQLINKLSADSADLRIVAGRALGEVVRKLGDRVLPAVVPHLRAGLEGGDLGMREGVCLGLAEILQASTRRQIEDYISVLVPALQQGLSDPSEIVRSQAAKAFQTLCKALGPRAIEDVLPSLIEKVARAHESREEPNLPLLGLREIVSAKSRDILEYLLPKIFGISMSSSSAFVLGSIADVSGSVLQYHFGIIIPGFCRELIAASNAGAAAESHFSVLKESASNVMAAVTTAGVNSLCHDLKSQVEHESSVQNRQWGIWLLEQFVRRSKANFLEYAPLLLKFVLARVAENDTALLQAVSDAMAGIAASIDMDNLITHIDFIRSCISSTASDAKHSSTGHMLLTSATGEVQLPLFSVPKSLEPLLAIFTHGVLNGNPQVRENAADGIGEMALLTESAALKPYLIKSTGPLIRVVGDRIPSNVKTSILQV